MYAIIEDSGTQIKVSEGDVIRIDQRELSDASTEAPTVTFDKVLMVGGGNEGESKIGRPYVEGAKVSADVLDEDLSKKYEIVKFRRRKNYRLRKGHRQHYIQVRVTEIQG